MLWEEVVIICVWNSIRHSCVVILRFGFDLGRCTANILRSFLLLSLFAEIGSSTCARFHVDADDSFLVFMSLKTDRTKPAPRPAGLLALDILRRIPILLVAIEVDMIDADTEFILFVVRRVICTPAVAPSEAGSIVSWACAARASPISSASTSAAKATTASLAASSTKSTHSHSHGSTTATEPSTASSTATASLNSSRLLETLIVPFLFKSLYFVSLLLAATPNGLRFVFQDWFGRLTAEH
jgi:hypothetical protein